MNDLFSASVAMADLLSTACGRGQYEASSEARAYFNFLSDTILGTF